MKIETVLRKPYLQTRARMLLALVLILGLSLWVLFVPGLANDNQNIAGLLLRDSSGNTVGFAWLKQLGDTGDENQLVMVSVWVMGLPPGFHGTHFHERGVCDPPDFMEAGGHYNPTGVNHPDHAGDLSTLLINQGGMGYLTLVTDRFEIADLLDEDGAALIVHANPDNFANIPERYGGPDEMTLEDGDSGARLACGELTRMDRQDPNDLPQDIQDLMREFQFDEAGTQSP